MTFEFFLPTKILFGAGALNELAQVRLPGRKALIVTSGGGSMVKYGYLERVQNLLEAQGVAHVLYNKILPNPIKDHVMEGAALAKREGCDFIIGLGGGSSIDSAKSMAVMATNPGDYWEYISGGSGQGQPLVNAPLPIVAITTTAGTGTEADPFTVITHNEEKIGFGAEGTFPALAIVDPELMVSVPAKLTAYQGFDALLHAMEGYISVNANAISDLLALEAIRLVAQNLPKAVACGEDLEARGQVALANTLAGMVESLSGCTSEHALEHALSAKHPDLPHGAGLIALCAPYFEFFSDKLTARMVDMARALGYAESNDPLDCVRALLKLQEDCGVSDLKLSAYGVDGEHLEDYALNAMATMGGLFGADRYKLDLDEVYYILQGAFA